MNKARKITEVNQYIEKLAEPIQEITETLREIILETSPALMEEYKWSMPNYTYKGLICYLQASKNHVNLGFQKGNLLQEKYPHLPLQGSGKTMRHIRVKKQEEIKAEEFSQLIQAAVELNEE
jgi:hypothetical protein